MTLKTQFNDLAAQFESCPLPEVNAAGLDQWQASRRAELLADWGLEHRLAERSAPPPVTITGTSIAEDHEIDRLWFEASAGLVVTANLYRPTPATDQRAPAILYFCGHHPNQKIHYQEHARHLAQLGFVTLILDTLQYGELPGHHHGTHHLQNFHWISRGYSAAAIEAWIGLRAYDLLVDRADVDASRIGATGHSGGGAVSWWVAALEPGIAAMVSSSGTGGEVAHVVHHTIDSHCDCYFPVNPSARPLAEIYALVAPRPTLVLAPTLDAFYEPGSVRDTVDRLARWHREQTGRDWPLERFAFPAEHRYTPESRQRAFAWLVRHLRPPRADRVGADVDGVRLPPEDLTVLGPGVDRPTSGNDRVADWFCDTTRAPSDLSSLPGQILTRCLGFGDPELPTEARVTRRFQRRDVNCDWFEAVTEPGATITGERRVRVGEELPPVAEVHLLTRDDDRRWPYRGDPLVGDGDVTLAVRGTGFTAWHVRQDWHLRRVAALLGRPFGALRTWDILRGLAAARDLFGVDQVHLVASRELVVPALVASVCDPGVVALTVDQLPASLDLDDPAARVATAVPPYDPHHEIGHLLTITDIPALIAALTERGVTITGSIDQDRPGLEEEKP